MKRPSLMDREFNLPMPSRLYVDGTFKGARHETHDDQDFEYVISRRRQPPQAGGLICEEGLTQQATNNTCVTARRDGHLFSGVAA